MNDYIIIANGQFLVREIIEEAKSGKTIVALDGAVNKLQQLQIMPQVILGDFDSITSAAQIFWGIEQTYDDLTEKTAYYTGKYGVKIVPVKDQLHTDLVKAIRYCDQCLATSITIICASGGRADHTEGNKIALRTEYRYDRPIILYTEQQTLRYAMNETILMNGKIGDYCGILATNPGTCTSLGLEYECINQAVSICNRLKSSSATLTINGGALLIMPAQLVSQRDYMSQTEANRLKLQLRDLTA